MADLFQQESPLVQIKLAELEAGSPRIQETAFLGFLNVRGRPEDTEFLAAVKSVLGCELPVAANTMVENADYRVYWLGPDEWLVVTATGQQSRVQAALRLALGNIFSSVVDNSSGLTMLKISGENADKLIARDCPLDLHPRAFKAGACAQTRLAKAGMTIAPLRDECGFEVIIRRSFADYILLWMQDGLIEFA